MEINLEKTIETNESNLSLIRQKIGERGEAIHDHTNVRLIANQAFAPKVDIKYNNKLFLLGWTVSISGTVHFLADVLPELELIYRQKYSITYIELLKQYAYQIKTEVDISKDTIKDICLSFESEGIERLEIGMKLAEELALKGPDVSDLMDKVNWKEYTAEAMYEDMFGITFYQLTTEVLLMLEYLKEESKKIDFSKYDLN